MKILNFKGFVAFVLLLQLVLAGPFSAAQHSYAASTVTEGLIHQFTSNTWANSNLFTSPNGDLYLSHVKGVNEIAIKKWENNTWKEITTISASASGDSGFNAGVSNFAIDGNNTIYAAFLFYRGSGVTSERGVKVGIYKNGSWSFEKVESAQDNYGWKNMDDPRIAYDANGKAHVVYLYSDANDPRKYEVHYATNQSGSWVTKTLVTGTSGIDEVHDPQIKIDRSNTIHITYVKEDNQNDYYGNVYYTHKNVSAPEFPPTPEKIIDSITDHTNYYPAPFVVDSSGKIYISYSDEAYTSYLLTNKSGTWTKEVFSNDGMSYPFKTSIIDNKVYVMMYKEIPGGPPTFFAMVKEGSAWKKGTKEVSSNLMKGYPYELISEMDANGNIMIVMEDSGLRNVTYLNGTSEDFGLTVEPPRSNNADLSGLSVNPGTLTPAFSAGQTSYTASVGYNVQSISVTPTVADAKSTVTVNGVSAASGTASAGIALNVGVTLISVAVTAEDGTRKTYTITVNRAAPSNNTNLAHLSADSGVLNPIFQSGIYNYSIDVPNRTNQIRLTPTVADAAATVTVGGNRVESGQVSPAISLSTGRNEIPIVVTAQDGSTKTYTVTVNRNRIPIATDGTFTVDENAANGTAVGRVTANDPDGQPLTYRILSGNANGIFAINGTTGDITVADGSLLDYEKTQTYTLTVEVSDGADKTTVTVTIQLNDLNDNLPVPQGFTTIIDENLANGTVVGKVTATDADANSIFTYKITAGNGSGAFAVDPSSGEVTVADSVQLDYETIKTFTLTIQVSDGVHTTETKVNIHLNNLNDNRPVAEDAIFEVDENAPIGTFVGKVKASDADGDLLRYQILSGNEAGAFAINSLTGEITVADSSQLDYEKNTSYQLRVQALDTVAPQGFLAPYALYKALIQYQSFDAVETDIAMITIHVTNLNDNPPVPQGFSKKIDENSAAGTSVGFVTATDDDEGSVLSYKLTAGNEAGAFALNEDTGEVTVADASKLDFEKIQSFTLTVEVSDGAHTAATAVFIQLNNLNDNPPVVNDAVFDINENAANGTAVGTVMGKDADGDSLNYEITAGNETGAFTIDAATGTISVADAGILDFEKVQSFTLTVGVNDGLHTVEAAITINLNNVNDNAPVGEDAIFTIDENSPNGTIVGTVAGHDSDGDSLHYRIAAGNEAGAFAMNGDTGEVTVADSLKLDYEKVQSFTLTVEVSDGVHTAASTVTVELNNVNDNQPIVNDAVFEIDENAAIGTAVGTVTGQDADGDSLYYEITSGNESGAFAIDAATGTIRVADAGVLDYEKVQGFTLTVQVNDGLHTAEAAVTINLNNVNDNAPVGEDASFTIAETAEAGTKVGVVEASDADGDDLTYAIMSGNEDGIFTVNETTGEISVADSSRLSAKEKALHALSIGVSDGQHTSTVAAAVHVLSSDSTLSQLTISAGNMKPAFTPGVTQYTIFVAKKVEAIAFTPTAAHQNAAVKLNGKPITSGHESELVQLKEGRNLQTIEVTSENGQTTTYTITVIHMQPVVKVVPEASDEIVTVSEDEVDLLDDNGTLIFELKGTRSQDKMVKITAEQLAILIERHASIQVLGEGVEMFIPAANFTEEEDAAISIKRVDKHSVSLPFAKLAAGDIYELTIKQGDNIIHQFDRDIELAFSVNGHAHPEKLKLHYFNEDKKQWELVGGTFEDGKVMAKTNHFSTFALFDPTDLVKDPGKKPTTGGELPETSTNMYNWLLAGLLLIMGGAMLRIQHRRAERK